MIKNIRSLVVIGAMVLFPMSVFAEDVPMTEEEVCFEEDYAIEAQTEEEVLIVAEEDGFLEEDGLIEDDEELQAADARDSGTCGVNVNWKYNSERNLILYGNGEMWDYGIHSSPWDKYRSDIFKVIIENGVTSIGDSAFYQCVGIQSITIPDGLKSIGKFAFGYCSNLTSITIPDGVTSIGGSAFANCSSIKNIEIPDSVTSIGYYAFSHCSKLTKITIPDSVTSIADNAFTGCNNLTIYANAGSYAERYAKENGISCHTHSWDSGKVTKAATATSTGIRTYTCTVCGETKTESIPKLKANNPAEKKTITKKPSIKKPTAKKTSITVKWKHFKHTSKKAKKIWKKIKKVQVQCATDSGFKNIIKDVKIGRGKTKYAIKGLSKKTTYYVRVRYFDGVGYSAWSKVKKVKTK